MRNPSRELIVNAVQLDLERIVPANSPFTTNVRLVSQTIADPLDFASRQGLPGIAIVDKGDKIISQVSNEGYIIAMGLTLILYIPSDQNVDATGTALNEFYADVRYAMVSSQTSATGYIYRTHRDTCITTEWTGHDAIAVEGDMVSAMMMDFDVIYRSFWSLP